MKIREPTVKKVFNKLKASTSDGHKELEIE